MTISLAAIPVMDEQLDLLSLVADTSTPLGSLHRDDFEAACRAVAEPDGRVNPNKVSEEMHRRFGEINSRWYSGMWSSACSRKGFMDKTTEPVLIDATHSRGNGNKATVWRRIRPTT